MLIEYNVINVSYLNITWLYILLNKKNKKYLRDFYYIINEVLFFSSFFHMFNFFITIPICACVD